MIAKPPHRRTSAIEYDIVRILMVMNIWWIGVFIYKNPITSFLSVKKLVLQFKKMVNGQKIVRGYKTAGKYAWDTFNPSWPSKAFNNFYKNHLLEINPVSSSPLAIRRLLVMITKRCPLNCEHCSEGETLNQPDMLSLKDLETRISSFVNQGVSQIVYTGGEPINRLEDLIYLITKFKDTCDQWIYTSGYGLKPNIANALKKAGLNGAAVSLDNHIVEAHNLFRRNDRAYFWATEGLKNCQSAGLFTALNICPTKDYIEAGSMENYIHLAKELHVPVVNILEPRAVGNYGNQDVELDFAHKETLQVFAEKYNFTRSLKEFPTIIYPGAYRRSMQCGGGRSYMLLDYDGSLYPCPFCKTKIDQNSQVQQFCTAEKQPATIHH